MKEFTVDCLGSVHNVSLKFGSISWSLFLVSLFQSFCQIVPTYIFTLGLKPDQQTRERAAKLDVKATFASLSALSFPIMPTREGIHAMIIWICGGNFRRL